MTTEPRRVEESPGLDSQREIDVLETLYDAISEGRHSITYVSKQMDGTGYDTVRTIVQETLIPEGYVEWNGSRGRASHYERTGKGRELLEREAEAERQRAEAEAEFAVGPGHAQSGPVEQSDETGVKEDDTEPRKGDKVDELGEIFSRLEGADEDLTEFPSGSPRKRVDE